MRWRSGELHAAVMTMCAVRDTSLHLTTTTPTSCSDAFERRLLQGVVHRLRLHPRVQRMESSWITNDRAPVPPDRRPQSDAQPAPAARRHARARARSQCGRPVRRGRRRWPRGSCLWLHAHIGAGCPMHPVGASHASSACLPRAAGSRFGMNSGATQRAAELAAADPANRAQLGRRRELGERRRPKELPRRAAFEHEPESAAARGVSGACGRGRPGVLHRHGRQATLKDEHPAQHPTVARQHATKPVFNTLAVSVLLLAPRSDARRKYSSKSARQK